MANDKPYSVVFAQIALEAAAAKKIYTIYGRYVDIRRALDARGWVEKPPPSLGSDIAHVGRTGSYKSSLFGL